jgi:hypothetical protein
LHPIILASECYLKIVAINPFEKGNLQIANLVLNWMLAIHNYLFTNVEEYDENKTDKSVFTNYILRQEKVNLIRAIELVSK